MAGFVLGIVCLFVLAAVALLRRSPNEARVADLDDPNLRWYEQRSRELQQEDETLLDEARLRLIEDGAPVGLELQATGGRATRFLGPALLVAVVVVSLLVYSQTGALEDVLIHRQLSSLSPEAGDDVRLALLERIEKRSRQREDNLQYLGLLGRLYMAAENYEEASASFARLVEKTPEDPQALALAAQARFLASGRQLGSSGQLLAERALAVDPDQGTALGLLGMSSFEAGEYRAAITYWERLQALEQPGSQAYQMLDQVLAMARERAGGPRVAGSGETLQEPSEDQGPLPRGVSVALSLEDGARTDPGAVIFVFARLAASAGGMPLAVRRLRAAELPRTLRLSDSDSMAGGRLSTSGEVVVSAQLSRNGQPGVGNALFAGSSMPIAVGGADARVDIELKSVPNSG